MMMLLFIESGYPENENGDRLSGFTSSRTKSLFILMMSLLFYTIACPGASR